MSDQRPTFPTVAEASYRLPSFDMIPTPGEGRRMMAGITALAVVAAVLVPIASWARPLSRFQGAPPAAPALQPARAHPFGVGEVLEYELKVAFARGRARLEIIKLDTVRDRAAMHANFSLRGGVLGLKVDEKYDTWVDVATISTLRYYEDVRNSFDKRNRKLEFFPETRTFTDGTDTIGTVERPVDQASVFYLIRTLDLRVGLDTNINNYFLADRNPIRIQVVGRERITVGAGTFDAFIVHPVIKSKGLFSEGGEARVWISDDPRRVIVQIKAKVPGFTLTTLLKSYTPAPINLPVTSTHQGGR